MLLAEGAMGIAAPIDPPKPSPSTQQQAAETAPPLALKVRRQADGLEIVLEGAGQSPQLRQGSKGRDWQGTLTTSQPRGVFVTPQRFSLPEAGIQSITLDGGGNQFRLDVTPLQGVQLGRPVVSADGQNLILTFSAPNQGLGMTARPNLNQPGVIPQAAYAPPLQPRAVAPPLGDMAVGSMVLRNQSFVNASGPNVTLTLRNAPAKDALMAIAQIGGYGFVYVDDAPASGSGSSSSSPSVAPSISSQASPNPDAGRLVTISFRNESYARALNSVLLAAGLQGKLEGRMILAGPSVLGKSFGPQMSKVFRLNQASAASAADYLASLGAKITKVTVLTNIASTGQAQQNQVAGASQSQQTTRETITTTETYGASTGPLKGLAATSDSRLQTVTIIGDPALVAVAENYLKQIDLRQRQVALSVKILDVTLSNDADVQNSFAFRYGNNFIVNDSGKLLGAFNSNLPPTETEMRGAATGNPEIKTANPTYPPVNPGMAYQQNNFYDYVRAQIESTSTKVLASPTLILSENPETITGGAEVASGSATSGLASATIGRPRANESFVTVGTQEITSFTVVTGVQGSPNTCQPQFETAGLTFGARISKIDDNGFVTFTLSPSISAVAGLPVVIPGCGPIKILRTRRLDTGSVRVRDGQTLILTGVISDADSQTVTKWPIVGDIPLIGQFFRSSNSSRSKNELVILVTPRIIDDTDGGSYGYGYSPRVNEAQRMMSGSM
jgi:type IV pilus assembly protein PilQ